MPKPKSRLRATREQALRLTRAEFASLVERKSGEPCDERMVWRWEEAGIKPRPARRRAIATITGLSAAELGWANGERPDESDRLLEALDEPRRADADTVNYFGRILDVHRQSSRLMRPPDLVAVVAPTYDLIGRFRRDTPDQLRRPLLTTASEVAQFVGRMHFEAGDDQRAAEWSDRALNTALQAGDDDLVAFTLARRTSIAESEGDPAAVVDLARAARRRARLPASIESLAWRCEAKGHAMFGDADGCRRALDRAAEVLAGGPNGEDDPPYAGGYSLEFLNLQAAACDLRLGRRAAAIDTLERELPTFEASREKAWNVARLAAAYAAEGELGRAAELAEEALAMARATGSVRAIRELESAGITPDV
jgi:tetratricopeptide (TPR) repeat protein